MKKIEKIVNGPNETQKLAQEFAKQLKPNDIVFLFGNLGAGKTNFTTGILKYFGYEDQISSPTFTIVNEYMDYDDMDKLRIYHFDLYRLANKNDFYDIGGEEYHQRGITIFEWPEIIKEDYTHQSHYEVHISKLEDANGKIKKGDEDKRKITIEKV